MELVKDADGGEEAGEEQEGPEDSGCAKAEKAEGIGDREGPGRVAHDEHGAGVKAGGVLDGPDGVAVVGIVVVDELATSGPVREEVATGSQFACNGDSKDVKDRDGKREAGDSGNRNLGNVARILNRREVRLAGHGGYSRASSEYTWAS